MEKHYFCISCYVYTSLVAEFCDYLSEWGGALCLDLDSLWDLLLVCLLWVSCPPPCSLCFCSLLSSFSSCDSSVLSFLTDKESCPSTAEAETDSSDSRGGFSVCVMGVDTEFSFCGLPSSSSPSKSSGVKKIILSSSSSSVLGVSLSQLRGVVVGSVLVSLELFSVLCSGQSPPGFTDGEGNGILSNRQESVGVFSLNIGFLNLVLMGLQVKMLYRGLAAPRSSERSFAGANCCISNGSASRNQKQTFNIWNQFTA